MKSLPVNLATVETTEAYKATYLYELIYQGFTYRFTSWNENLIWNMQSYYSAPILHSSHKQPNGGSLTVQIGVTHGPAKQFLLTPPTGKATLCVYRVAGDLANITNNDVYRVYSGILATVTVKGVQATMNFAPILDPENTSIPNCFYQKQCNWRLFERDSCKLPKKVASVTVAKVSQDEATKTVVLNHVSATGAYNLGELSIGGAPYRILTSAFNATTQQTSVVLEKWPVSFTGEVTIAKFSYSKHATIVGQDVYSRSVVLDLTSTDNYFNLGEIVIGSFTLSVKSSVFDSATGYTTVVLGSWPDEVPNGSVATVVPGCDKLLGTCIAKFNNKINFGGFPFIPFKNLSLGEM